MPSYEQIFFAVGHVWGVAACLLLVIAWVIIVVDPEGYERLHKRLMIAMTSGGWAFVLLYLSGYYLRSTSPHLSGGVVAWLAVHGTIALIALSGATLLTWARLTDLEDDETLRIRAHLNRRHTLWGRIIGPLWLFSHIGGIVNLYITG